MVKSFAAVNDLAQDCRLNLRTAAYMLAIERVAEAIRLRGIYP
jgi:glutamate dehydrogenase/leucine dehydrogenase